jgi:glutaconyl-CoA/methylmalonyl-CoA decarboxylase subunit gamma
MIKHLRVTINGKSYDVTVEELGQGALAPVAAVPSGIALAAVAAPPSAPAPVSAAAAAPAPAAASASAGPASGGPNERTAPLGGTVVDIPVAVGDIVAVDQPVVVLEAMKMKTAIGAHKAGRIAAIYVSVGDGVDVEQALLSIE